MSMRLGGEYGTHEGTAYTVLVGKHEGKRPIKSRRYDGDDKIGLERGCILDFCG